MELTTGWTTVSSLSGSHVEPLADEARMDAELVGKQLDKIEIRSFLGAGAMGRVYLGFNIGLHRHCAVKVISPELAEEKPERLAMFFGEARSAARFHHPNIVTVHALNEDRGYHYIEMEYVEGVSLSSLLKKYVRLTPLMATRLVAHIAAGLAVAHERGVIHCDVKPANVMVADRLEAKLTDFGLARIFADGPSRRGLVGTPLFMAPELFRGMQPGTTTDVYALGATYYQLLCGAVPFQATSISELKDLHEAAELPAIERAVPGIDYAIGSLLRELLSRNPADRPVCNRDLVRRIDNIAQALLDPVEVLSDALSEMPEIVWQSRPGLFNFDVSLPDGRSQRVYGELNHNASSDVGQLFSFWTPCGKADPRHYAFVLELNGRLPFGAVSIREHLGEQYFVMFQNHARASADPDEIRGTILNLANWADHIERKLTGKDEF